jgi:hypothetical protein
MQRSSGTNSGIPDMASCQQALSKWKEMGVTPTSVCTCSGSGGAASSGGAFGAVSPLGLMQQMHANSVRQAQQNAQLAAQSSVEIAAAQSQALDAVHEQQIRDAQSDAERARRKREELMAQLSRGIANTELAATGRTETIDLRAGTSFFGGPANPTGSLTTVIPGAPIVVAPPPETPAGKPVDPSEKEKIEEAYRKAATDHVHAEELRRKLEEEKKQAEKKRAEAERKHQEQQARVQSIPQDQAGARKDEDDKLAEAERLLKEATDLDQKASEDLEKAEKGIRAAEQELDRTGRARSQFEAAAQRGAPEKPN